MHKVSFALGTGRIGSESFRHFTFVYEMEVVVFKCPVNMSVKCLQRELWRMWVNNEDIWQLVYRKLLAPICGHVIP